MIRTLSLSLRAAAVTLVLTGLVYPLLVWAVAQAAFPREANGSFVTDGRGVVVGSELIAQPFTHPAYVRPRPSAAGTAKGGDGVEFLVSSGSNLGPTSKALRERAAEEAARLRAENPAARGEVPSELVTASGSGLDPHLSLASVEWQVPRIAKARGVAEDRVRAVAASLAEGRDLGVLGEPRVNVLAVNLAMDRHFGPPPRRANIPPR